MINTIVAQLGRTASRWQHVFLKKLGYKVFHEPIGGWKANEFDSDLSWDTFLETRRYCCPEVFSNSPAMLEKLDGYSLKDVIENNEYIEVGFASLPFIENIPDNWKLLGVVRHPKDWIESAIFYKFYLDKISWRPMTASDYAVIWNTYNTKILEKSEKVFKLEDFDKNPELFAGEFGYTNPIPQELKSLDIASTGDIFRYMSPARQAERYQVKFMLSNDDSWKEIVSDLAKKLEYLI